ncbi:MAG: sigma 54-interacting transcriptional regulator [Desulfocapsaceae bacterium]|jgi:transcriptional regulator with AAA-type ATPase domain|nr:sigma 54-interacting transcriptional regulator [Desulfocapsaceae bacterium]
MKPEAIQQNLQQSVIFSDIGAEQLAEITENVEVRHVAQGDFIHRRGDQANSFYIVATGEVELTLQGDDGALSIVGRVGPGGHFGETSLLTGRPQSLTIRALCDVVLICLSNAYFHQLLGQNRLVQERIECALAERLRISFQDHAASVLACDISTRQEIRLVDMMPLSECISADDEIDGQKDKVLRSQTAREIQQAIEKFSANDRPVLLTGETGTGRRLLAKQIHLQSSHTQGPYIEVDARDFNADELARRLFGEKNDPFPFSQVRQTGVFEQFSRGTVVLHHLDRIPLPVQKKIADAIETLTYTRVGGERQIALEARIIFVSEYPLETLKEMLKIIRQLEQILEPATFHVPALRFHKRDLPQLVDYYLHRFSREYGKNISSVSPGTLGVLMNYDWPGNLIELSAVIQRAVMLARDDEILSEHILLGLPKSEGKWEFNLLRVPWIRTVLESRFYPDLPRFVVGTVLLAAVITLFFGPADPEKNIGITLSWAIGWPLLFFSFFFMARTWCSVCTLAVPGTMLQSVIRPTRKTPEIIKTYSGWIMSVLCIIVLWVEVVWNAYESPMLTGWIIVAITIGSIVFSVFFSRRSWCRYLCPLGAINAIFAMPSILELRSNRHLCLNRCEDHACYTGMVDKSGCPMFRHPFMVDNNKDCIICGDCIKSCNKHSIHLNLRLAPQELWDIEEPRQADSFLIISLGAIFFPFALHSQLFTFIQTLQQTYPATLGQLPFALIGSCIFFALIFIFQIGYFLMVQLQAHLTKVNRKILLPLLGYGFIPIILGVYLAVHFEVFVSQSWRLVANLREIVGLTPVVAGARLISPDASALLQVFTVAGGFLASLYATYRITDRLKGGGVTNRDLILPYSFLAGFTVLFVFFMKTSKIILF